MLPDERPHDTDRLATQQFSAEEAEAIETEAWRRRRLDRELADVLDEPAPTARAATSRILRNLAGPARLSPALERELVLAAKRGDRAATARLVEAFLPLVASVARIYRSSRAVDRIELMQEGVVGLLRALECYDPERGTPFWAYASWWVRQAMQHLVAELTRPVVLSDRALRQLARVKDAHRARLQARGREPSVAELASESGLDPAQVENLVAADRAPRALEQPLDREDGSVGTFGELLADPLAEDEYELVVGRLEVEELRSLLSGLSDRERAVLRARYGLDGAEQTLREIGGAHGLSAERVRQIEQRALGKLRAAAGVDAESEGNDGIARGRDHRPAGSPALQASSEGRAS